MYLLVHFFQSFPQDREFFKFWVESKDRLRFEAGLLDESDVTQILHGAVGDSGLARSQKLSRAADLKILFGEFEAIFGINQSAESL